MINVYHFIGVFGPGIGGPFTSLMNIIYCVSGKFSHVICASAVRQQKGCSFDPVPTLSKIAVVAGLLRGRICHLLIPGRREVSSIFHIHGLWEPISIFFILFAFILGIPVVLSPRGMLMPYAMSKRPLLKRFLFFIFFRPLLTRVRIIHATSEAELVDLNRRGFTDIILLPNIVHDDSCQENLSEDMGDEIRKRKFIEKFSSPIYLSLGRIHPTKGHDVLISAFALAREYMPSGATLIIAGAPENSDYLVKLRKRIALLKVEDRVIIRDFCSGKEKTDLLKSAYFFVSASHGENFGNAILEAMRAEIPVIISRECPWSLVLDLNAGFWIENSPRHFYEAFKKSANLTYDEYSSMKKGARNIAARFESSKIAMLYADLYVKLATVHSLEA